VTDEQLLRYSRHILLDALGIDGQERILGAHALVVGAGGLGSPAAIYLASAGVGKLTLVDDDTVDFTNLQRQILHTQSRVGMAKAESGRQALAAINPDIAIVPCSRGSPALRSTRWWRPPMSFSTAPTTSPPGTPSTAPASITGSRWFPAQPYASMARSVFTICAATTRRATTACFPRATMSRKCVAR
jgi:hypothetical protein